MSACAAGRRDVERETDTANLADQMVSHKQHDATVRFSVITAVQATPGRKVQTDATDAAWLPRSLDTSLAVGDRVWLLQQGAIWIVGGRLSGEPGASPIGMVAPFATVAAPDGWLACDGAAISRTTYATLFAAIGTGYGAGDGSTTFNVPDLRERAVVGTGPGRARAATGGAATVALTTAELPAHDHGNSGSHSHTIPQAQGQSTVQSGTGATVANATAGTTGSGTHTHTSVGSGSAHENMPPFQVLLYCVRAL